MFEPGKCIYPKNCNRCCKVFSLNFSDLKKDEMWRLRHLATDKITVEERTDEDGIFHRVNLFFPCEYLKDGECSIYPDRPKICKKYPEDEAAFIEDCLGGGRPKT